MNYFFIFASLLVHCWCLVESAFQLNPGLAIGVNKDSIDNKAAAADSSHFLLHPSLTSTSYLEARPPSFKRRAKKTNFQALKNSLLKSEFCNFSKVSGNQKETFFPDSDQDNLAIETAPYASLPESYQSILPASYYATHTFVPPIEGLYSTSGVRYVERKVKECSCHFFCA